MSENILHNQVICICGYTCRSYEWTDHVKEKHPEIDIAFSFYYTSPKT